MTKNISKGIPVVHASTGGLSLDREAITVGHQDIPVRFYRTSDPTIFAGFQIDWIDGRDETTGAEINLSCGAGVGSKYMTLSISMPGHPTVYEYVDISEVFNDRAVAILAEIADEGVCEDSAATQTTRK